MIKTKFLLNTHPLRVLAEVWLLGTLIILGYAGLMGQLSSAAFNNGVLLLCGFCGLWAVLRTRMPRGHWLIQGFKELVIGCALSLVMALGLYAIASVTTLVNEWIKSNWGPGAVIIFLLLTGPGYVCARIGLRGWLFWDRLRRRRMLWSLTHAHLLVVVLAAVIGAAGIFVSMPYYQMASQVSLTPGNPFVVLADRLLLFFFPASGVMLILTLVALAMVLPPSAIFSFLFARQTTRRLVKLAAAATALRSGDYRARVSVTGEDEVAQLQADFNAMAEKLEGTLSDLQSERDRVARLLQSRRELVASVSHELRTPVATMRALLDSALEHAYDAPPPLQHDLTVVQSEVTRLQGLIDDLFTLSRAEAGGLALECRATDVGPVIRRMVEAVQPLAWQSGRVEVVADVPQDLPDACVDTERLEQVLANLLRNGVRYTPPGGIVSATARGETEHVVIEVRDTGYGIAPDDLPHIWERFYRGQPGDAHDGAGLGLAIVQDLVEAMGGSVSVESVVGQGSRFTVRLRRA
jgi:signal transduction histidine kinase